MSKVIAQRRPLDIFHRDEVAALVRDSDLMDNAYVGVVKCGGCAGFLFETTDTFSIGGEFLRNQFQRDVAAYLCVAREVDLAHSTCAQRAKYFVTPYSFSGCKLCGLICEHAGSKFECRRS